MTDIGHNNPPPPTPLEEARETLSMLDEEARNWFDGKPIENQVQADSVARLIAAARQAKTQFDNARKAEKEPHDKAAKAVDAAWKPVITDAERIAEIGKKAQTPWLLKIEAEKRAIEEAARIAAEQAAAQARKLAAEADGSLAAAKARDAAIEAAKRSEADAARASRDKAGAKGAGMARAIGLRSQWGSVVEDRRTLLNYIAKHDPDALTGFLEDWAARAVRAGVRELPGVIINEEKVAA